MWRRFESMKFSGKGQLIFRRCFCLLLFLLPLKFGWQIGSQEEANCPLNVAEWLLFTMWPQQLFWLLSSLALAFSASLSLNRKPLLPSSSRVPFLLTMALPILTLLAGIFGLIHTTEWNYAWNWFGNGISAVMLAAAAALAIPWDKAFLPAIFRTLAVSCLVCAFHGWYQHFFGIDANLELMKDNAAAAGIELTQQMLDKLAQTRVHGTFVDPNIYAAHLLLTLPFCVKALWDWGHDIEPKRHSPWILAMLGCLLAVGAIYWSGSRSAVFGCGAMIGACLWMKYLAKSRFVVKGAVILALVIMMAGGLFAMTKLSHRDLSTASVRMEYYSTASSMFRINPVCGVGLGEFFPWHLRLKPAGADEARDAHSQFFMMLAQCGIFGGISAAIRLVFPALLLLGVWKTRRNKNDGAFLAACAGWLAWNVHSLFQFDDVVMSLAAYVAVVPFFCWDFPHQDALPESRAKCGKAGLAVLCLAVVVVLFSCMDLSAEKTMQKYENALLSGDRLVQPPVSPFDSGFDWTLRSPYPYRMAGDLSMQQRKYADAEMRYCELLRLTPHRASSWRRLAEALEAQGKLEEAASCRRQEKIWYPNKPAEVEK